MGNYTYIFELLIFSAKGNLFSFDSILISSPVRIKGFTGIWHVWHKWQNSSLYDHELPWEFIRNLNLWILPRILNSILLHGAYTSF